MQFTPHLLWLLMSLGSVSPEVGYGQELSPLPTAQPANVAPIYAPPSVPTQVIPAAPQQPAFRDSLPLVAPSAEAPSGGSRFEQPELPPLEGRRSFEEPPVFGDSVRFPRLRTFFEQVVVDHRNYYSWRTAGVYAGAFGLGAVMANTSLDQHFQDWYQSEIGDSRFIHSFKYAGEGVIIVPSYVAAAGIGYVFDAQAAGTWIGLWGQRSLRTTLVGVTPMLFAQWLTGGSRPGERSYNSAWHPFQDVNSVSGHSFMGAIPFLTAAYMVQKPIPKVTLFGLSTLTAWSRVNDNAHYLSQIMLGWTMAVTASWAVADTEQQLGIQLIPMLGNGNTGLIMEWRQ